MTTDYRDDPNDLFYRGSSPSALPKCPVAIDLLYAERDRRELRHDLFCKLKSIIESPVMRADEWLPVEQAQKLCNQAHAEWEEVCEEIAILSLAWRGDV